MNGQNDLRRVGDPATGKGVLMADDGPPKRCCTGLKLYSIYLTNKDVWEKY